jgi:hypothetical protein
MDTQNLALSRNYGLSQQSSNFLLAIDSTNIFFSFVPRPFLCLEIGPLFDEREGLTIAVDDVGPHGFPVDRKLFCYFSITFEIG